MNNSNGSGNGGLSIRNETADSDYRESIKKAINATVKSAFEQELRQAVQELAEEQRKVIRQLVDRHKSVIREVVEEERRKIRGQG